MSDNNNLVNEFFKKTKITKPIIDKEVKGTRTGRTESSSSTTSTMTTDTTVSSKPSLSSLSSKYSWSDTDRTRRKRRFSYECFDDHVELLPKIARRLASDIDVNISASHLVRKYVEEGIQNTLAELGLKLEDFS